MDFKNKSIDLYHLSMLWSDCFPRTSGTRRGEEGQTITSLAFSQQCWKSAALLVTRVSD